MGTDPTPVTGDWFRLPVPRPEAPQRLVLFPHGGGAAASYGHWAALLPSDVELVVVQLPGRHDRLAERPFTAVGPLVAALGTEFESELDGRPFAFFGHSMGGMLAYELTLALRRDGIPAPELLAVSAWAPGGHRTGAGEISRLPDADLVAEVRAFGALPEAIASSPAMLAIVLPTLRADFAVYADFTDTGAPAPCPVAAYGGDADPLLLPGAMESWASGTSCFLGSRQYPGHHFYLEEHAVAVATDVARHLRRCSARRTQPQ